jgi:hypothetical protein
MHRVKFLVKNTDASDPEYRLISDRQEKFASFTRAMEFVRNIRARLSTGEALVGQPEIEVA